VDEKIIFKKEMNIAVYFEPKAFEFDGKKYWIGHGDGLGPGDHGYKFLKKYFGILYANGYSEYYHLALVSAWLYYFSRKSRAKTAPTEAQFLGAANEWLISYCKTILQKEHFDFFVFGHRHLPIHFPLDKNSLYINLGDWIQYNSYAVVENNSVVLKYFNNEKV
jgi:UDP-2,3-diacylglucosamine hydrolase